MKQELKDLLKQPFRVEGARIVDEYGNYVEVYDYKLNGWQDALKNGINAVEKFGQFIADAMTEKAERDFIEPLRWKVDGEDKIGLLWYARCPKCKNVTNVIADRFYNYCPHCGQKLAEPEKGE